MSERPLFNDDPDSFEPVKTYSFSEKIFPFAEGEIIFSDEEGFFPPTNADAFSYTFYIADENFDAVGRVELKEQLFETVGMTTIKGLVYPVYPTSFKVITAETFYIDGKEEQKIYCVVELDQDIYYSESTNHPDGIKVYNRWFDINHNVSDLDFIGKNELKEFNLSFYEDQPEFEDAL